MSKRIKTNKELMEHVYDVLMIIDKKKIKDYNRFKYIINEVAYYAKGYGWKE